MKRNDISALHEKTVEELQQQLVELRQQLAHTRLERGAGKATLSKVRSLADDVARVKTVLREKELRAAAQAAHAVSENA
jgi:ribosomal protein L29